MQECNNALVLMFLKTALLVLKKDFAIEVKSLEILSTTMFFAVGCVLVFAFALVKEGQAPPDAGLSTAAEPRMQRKRGAGWRLPSGVPRLEARQEGRPVDLDALAVGGRCPGHARSMGF